MEPTSGTTATSTLPLSQAALGGGQAPALRRAAAESEFRNAKQSATTTATAIPILTTDAIPTATTIGTTIPTAAGTSSLTTISAPLPSSSTFSPGPLVAGLLLAGLAAAA